jgi:hypothetical protein
MAAPPLASPMRLMATSENATGPAACGTFMVADEASQRSSGHRPCGPSIARESVLLAGWLVIEDRTQAASCPFRAQRDTRGRLLLPSQALGDLQPLGPTNFEKTRETRMLPRCAPPLRLGRAVPGHSFPQRARTLPRRSKLSARSVMSIPAEYPCKSLLNADNNASSVHVRDGGEAASVIRYNCERMGQRLVIARLKGRRPMLDEQR